MNLLEIKAINLALPTFHKMFCLKAAHFPVDNITDLSYLMKMGGIGSREIAALTKEVWKFAVSQ